MPRRDQTISDATYDDLLYVGSWLSAADREELSVTRDPDDYVSLANSAWECPVKKIAYVNGLTPAFAFGARPVGDGLAIVWGFKTEIGWCSARAVTKYILTTMIPTLRATGIRRAVCLVHPGNVVSRKWLAHLGFKPEATKGFGSRDLILYGRDEPDGF